MFDYHAWKDAFAEAADETNDAADHDELHAASAVCYIMAYGDYAPVEYIDRWLLGLTKRVDKLLQK